MTQARINNLFSLVFLANGLRITAQPRGDAHSGKDLGIKEPFVDQAIIRIEGPTLIIGLFFWECQATAPTVTKALNHGDSSEPEGI